MCWFSYVVAERHFLGARTQGAMAPKIEFRCLYNAPTAKFHHPMFTHSAVIVLTNKQTDADENIQRSSLRYDVA